MKKFLFIAAAFAALVGCSKDASNPESAQSFVEGQTVTLSVSAPSSTKVTTSESGNKIVFKWQAGDQILVTVGDKSSNFTLKTGAGESSATFEGKMPASGDTFDAQYPTSPMTPTDVFGNQTYSSSEILSHDNIFLMAQNCSLSEGFSLSPTYGVMNLKLWGTSQTISKIVVDPGSSSEYIATLNISPAVTLPDTEAEAKDFYIIVPYNNDPIGYYESTVSIYDASGNEIMSKTAKVNCNAGQCTEMPALEVKKAGPPAGAVDLGLSVYWADHNVGATNPEDYGNMYQWAGTTDVTSTSIDLDWYNCPYHTGSSESSGWTKYTTKDSFSASGKADNKTILESSDDAAATSWGGNWRTPTNAELTELYENCTWAEETINGIYGLRATSKKDTSKSIFLPAAGTRVSNNLYGRGEEGYYWSSSLVSDQAESSFGYGGHVLSFEYDYVFMDRNCRYYGYSVRPVCPK